MNEQDKELALRIAEEVFEGLIYRAGPCLEFAHRYHAAKMEQEAASRDAEVQALKDEVERLKGERADKLWWPLIELGYGRIEVAEGNHEGRPALIFGRNGTGKIGEPTQPNRHCTHEETLAVVTFANVESLDVVLMKLGQLRARAVRRLVIE